MKKFAIFVLITFMGLYYSVNAQIQCPDGYSNPTTTLVHLCPGGNCPVEVTWCCFDGAGPIPGYGFYLHSVKFLVNPNSLECSCLDWVAQMPPLPAAPVIDMKLVIKKILSDPNGCFNNPFPINIPPCDENEHILIKVTNGGCYHYVSTIDEWGWFPCGSNPQITECHESYKICRRIVNGIWEIEIEANSPVTPIFNCLPGCTPLCGFLVF